MNILLINFGGIGDEILFLPTIQTLKEEYKNSKITLVLEPRSASIQNLTNTIDEIIKVDIKASGIKKYLNILKFLFTVWSKKFDILVISGSSPLVSILAFLTGIKRRIGYKSKTSFLLTDEVELNKNQYAGNMYHDLVKPLSEISYKNPRIDLNVEFNLPFEGEFVALHPGVSKMSLVKNILKCPDENFWRKLIQKLLETGKRVVLLGGPDDKEIIEKLSDINNENLFNMFGKTKNIQELASIINKSSAFVCVDSAPMHIGVSLEKNVYAIFAGTDPKKLIPNEPNFKVIKNKNCSCSPCLWDKRQTSCNDPVCLDIDPDEIVNLLQA